MRCRMLWMIVLFIKGYGCSYHTSGVCLEQHGFHLSLFQLGVLKGVYFRLFVLFCCDTVLVCAAIVADGFQVCSVSHVDSAIWSLDHV